MDRLLTVKDVCEMLKIGKTGAYKLFHRADFPKIVIGKKLYVKESDLMNYLTKYRMSVIVL